MPILKVKKNGQWEEVLGGASSVDGSKVYSQPEAPTDAKVGDLWVDTDAEASEFEITPEDIGAVSDERTINGKALSEDITLTAADIGATKVKMITW